MLTAYEERRSSKKAGITVVFADLRRMIDEKEMEINKKLEEIDAQNKRKFEEYQMQVKSKQKSVQKQSVAFNQLLADGDYRTILQEHGNYDQYLEDMTEEWFDLEPPTSIEFNVEGLDEFHATMKKAIEDVCVLEPPPYENPHLEQRIAQQSTDSILNLNNMGLTDRDMKIVARTLRIHTVRKVFEILLLN